MITADLIARLEALDKAAQERCAAGYVGTVVLDSKTSGRVLRLLRAGEMAADALTWTLEHHKAALRSHPHTAAESISCAEAALRRWDEAAR